MFQFFNKVLKKGFHKEKGSSPLASSRGQVAIILILVAAIGIILYAVSLNLAKISQIKTQITVASNASASFMASEMASYTQSLYETSLGGSSGTGADLSVCGWTGVVAVLIVIIAIIIIIVTYGWGTQVAIALIVAAAALVIQVAIVQPGLTDLWNKMMEGLAPPDEFVERGIQIAFQNTVTDNELVLDTLDFDTDGFFGAAANDKINRFGYYYTQRLKSQDASVLNTVRDFLEALEQFVYGYSKYDTSFDPDTMPRNWSLWDPICDVWTAHPCCQDPSDRSVEVPSECNPCCLPEELGYSSFSGFPPGTPIRPTCCDSPGSDYCGTATTCTRHSPYDEYPFVSFPYYEDESNNCIDMAFGSGCHVRPVQEQWQKHLSFKEILGRDDEHPAYQTANGDHKFEWNTGWPMKQAAGGGGFRAEDTRTFGIVYRDHLETEFVTTGALYDFLWALGDTKIDLSEINIEDAVWGSPEFHQSRGQCFWCDTRATRLDDGSACDPDPSCQEPIIGENPCCFCNEGSAGLFLPIDCSDDAIWPPDGPPCSWCVNENFDEIASLADFFTDYDKCASGNVDGIWKPGADRFCSPGNPPRWPYYAGCAKHGSCIEYDPDDGSFLYRRECECTEPGAGRAELWPDDPIDNMVYGINLFIDWAVELLKINREAAAENFLAWSEDAKTWIEFNVDPEEQGHLYTWRDLTYAIAFPINQWLEKEYFEGGSCDQMDEEYEWCIPPRSCRGVSQGEEEAWGLEGPITIDNVLLCHYWNGYERGGNTNKFTMCGTRYDPSLDLDDYPDGDAPTCSSYWCANLPRSVISGGTGDEFYSYVYECESDPTNSNTWNPATNNCFKEPDMDLVDAYQACLASIEDGTCSEETCGDLPDPPEGSGVTIPEYTDGVDPELLSCFNNCGDRWCSQFSGIGGEPYISPVDPYQDAKVCDDNGCSWLYCPPDLNGVPFNGCDAAYRAEVDRVLSDPAIAGSCAENPLSPFLLAVEEEIGDGGVDSCSDPNFRQAVEDAQCAALGSCCDDTWIDLMERSSLVSENQTVMFQHRYDYLLEQKGRAEKVYGNLATGAAFFTSFLNGPAQDLLDVADLPITDENEPLSNEVIYGWKGDPPEGRDEGYWHLVRIDSYLPQRCDGNCGQGGAIEPKFPTIKSYTLKGFLLPVRRCYSLGDSFGQPGCSRKKDYKNVTKCFKGGTVKNRIIRYDEDKETRRFPTGLDIWQFVFHHPTQASADPSALNACEGLGGGPNGGPGGPAGAFMLNGPGANPTCWNIANALLETGVTSQTCAEYFYHGVGTRGFSLKFVNCRAGDFQ